MDEFVKNEDIREVVYFNLFQIGEFANHLSVEFINNYNGVLWNQVRGMKNRIVHGYDNINLDIVWNTVKYYIIELQYHCKEIIK